MLGNRIHLHTEKPAGATFGTATSHTGSDCTLMCMVLEGRSYLASSEACGRLRAQSTAHSRCSCRVASCRPSAAQCPEHTPCPAATTTTQQQHPRQGAGVAGATVVAAVAVAPVERWHMPIGLPHRHAAVGCCCCCCCGCSGLDPNQPTSL